MASRGGSAFPACGESGVRDAVFPLVVPDIGNLPFSCATLARIRQLGTRAQPISPYTVSTYTKPKASTPAEAHFLSPDNCKFPMKSKGNPTAKYIDHDAHNGVPELQWPLSSH
ncbi:hypothetical protein DL766_004755 [Monosporascus sp. MC13-8B]|nr:hypothetical protein DL763_003055 [Monosporascus cannonballus]RYP30659.1 hypothetical protein DL766_004755 [Monosporascus sp. MC13-8B]